MMFAVYFWLLEILILFNSLYSRLNSVYYWRSNRVRTKETCWLSGAVVWLSFFTPVCATVIESDLPHQTEGWIMSNQAKEKPHHCDICGSTFTLKSNLYRHKKIHSGDKPHACDICPYVTVSKSHLARHMTTHTGEKPFICNVCQFAAPCQSEIMRHMKIHTGERPFVCNICGYAAYYKSNLDCHMRSHTGERPYTCKLCPYSAIIKNHLVLHMRTHTGEKPFSCNICDYSTTHSNNLVRHMRTHTGERPFECSMCEYSSSCKSTLLRHIRMHTGERPVKRQRWSMSKPAALESDAGDADMSSGHPDEDNHDTSVSKSDEESVSESDERIQVKVEPEIDVSQCYQGDDSPLIKEEPDSSLVTEIKEEPKDEDDEVQRWTVIKTWPHQYDQIRCYRFDTHTASTNIFYGCPGHFLKKIYLPAQTVYYKNDADRIENTLA